MKLGELFFNLGFHADSMKLKDFGKAVADLNMTSILTTGSFGALYEGASKLIGIADEMALGINKFGRETGQSTQDIQKWNHMAEQMGVSSGVVAGSIAHLEDSLFKMRITGEGSNFWSMLGLDPRNTGSMFDVLSMLRDRMKGMSTDMQRFFLENLGLSTEMLNIFKLTDDQWADIARQQTLSEDQLAQMDDTHKKMVSSSQTLQKVWADLGVAFSPIIEAFAEIAKSIDENILLSWGWKGVLDTISQVMTAIAHPFKTFTTALSDIPEILREYGPNLNMRLAPAQPGIFSPGTAGGILDILSMVPNLTGSASESSPTHINIKQTINTTDRNTTVETTSDDPITKKTVMNVVNQIGTSR